MIGRRKDEPSGSLDASLFVLEKALLFRAQMLEKTAEPGSVSREVGAQLRALAEELRHW